MFMILLKDICHGHALRIVNSQIINYILVSIVFPQVLLLTRWFPVLFHASSILEFGVASNISAPADVRRGVKGAQGVRQQEVRRSKDGLSRKYMNYFPKQRNGAHSRLYNWKPVLDC